MAVLHTIVEEDIAGEEDTEEGVDGRDMVVVFCIVSFSFIFHSSAASIILQRQATVVYFQHAFLS